ncbi:MAG: hypothetical protein ACTHOO_04205 [Alcanivorax sp.]
MVAQPPFEDNNPNDLNSEAEREQYFADVLINPDFEKYDADIISLKLGDTGNEDALADLKERADVSSGELGLMHAIERDVDQSMLRFQGSRSQNLSEGAQMVHEAMEAGDFPPPSDTNQVIQAVYGFMMFAGIPEAQLAAGMGADAKEGDLEMAERSNQAEDNVALIALYEIADKAKLGDEMAEYLQQAHAAHINDMAASGIRDLPQVVGTEPDPEENTPQVAMELNVDNTLNNPMNMNVNQAPSGPA